MKFNHFIVVFSWLTFLACQESQQIEEEIPVIRLDPNQAETLKTSDYFDKISVIRFNRIYRLDNFFEIGDCYLGKFSNPHSLYSQEFWMIDKAGNPLYQIGQQGRGPGEYMYVFDIKIGKDSTIRLLDNSKYLVYSLKGELLYEELLKEDFKVTPSLWQDSLIVYRREEFNTLNASQRKENRKFAEDKYLLNLYSIPKRKIIQTYFPMKDIMGLVTHDHLYEYNDTLCFYHDKDARIYEIHTDRLRTRYLIDKGKYGELQTREEQEKYSGPNVAYSRIDIYACNETSRYIIGEYCFKLRIYHFIYDKQTGITRNFRKIHDDLLGLTPEESSIHFIWKRRLLFKEDYLWNIFSRFLELTENIRSRLTPEEWKAFCRKHPDMAQYYKEKKKILPKEDFDFEQSSILVWKYHFK